jgi:hypothetical protein
LFAQLTVQNTVAQLQEAVSVFVIHQHTIGTAGQTLVVRILIFVFSKSVNSSEIKNLLFNQLLFKNY